MELTSEEVLQLLMKWRTRVSAAAWTVVCDVHAAEDIFQNVALKAMTKDLRFESEAALLSWAFVVARREGVDWLRRRQRETLGLDDELLGLLDQEWRSAPSHPSSVKIEALRGCLAAAPESARELLKLRYFDGHSCEEVAGRMGIGLNAVYKRVSRLHVDLKRCVEAKLAETEGAA